MRILELEDSRVTGEQLKAYLTKNGHSVEWVRSGRQAKALIDTEIFDIILLDLGIPDISGHDLLCYIRREGNKNQTTPTLIMTSNDTLQQKIQEIESGADDYLVKPCDLRELKVRIFALSRRRQGSSSNILGHGPIEIDLLSQRVFLNKKPVDLSPIELTLLQKLLENQGRILEKEFLLQHLYGWQNEANSNVVEAHICNLRKKLGKNLIKTKRGMGYTIEKVSSI